MQRGGRLWQGPHAKGRPAVARPPCKGAAGCGKAPYKGRSTVAKAPKQRGGRLRQGPPTKGWSATARASPQRGGARPRPDHKGSRPRVAGCSAAQRAADCGFGARRTAAYGQRHCPQGLPLARATASSGSACRGDARGGADRRGGRPLAEWLRPCKGSSDDDGDGGVRVKES
ncbi:hypothetical protein BHE74_00054956 [Ensete ventricosum]|nr:hypothetical protein BHE74_00054956 [Ensete ventricosum]RZR91332.1 hypothetical protein BHM03_00019429 [Ensete ventricosum]